MLAIVQNRAAFEPSATAPDGTRRHYVIFRPIAGAEGWSPFGESNSFEDHICHEFGHSSGELRWSIGVADTVASPNVINPLVDK